MYSVAFKVLVILVAKVCKGNCSVLVRTEGDGELSDNRAQLERTGNNYIICRHNELAICYSNCNGLVISLVNDVFVEFETFIRIVSQRDFCACCVAGQVTYITYCTILSITVNLNAVQRRLRSISCLNEKHLDETCIAIVTIALESDEVRVFCAQRNNDSLTFLCSFLNSAGVVVNQDINRTLSSGTANQVNLFSCRKSDVYTVFTFGDTVVGGLFCVFRELNTLLCIPTIDRINIVRNGIEGNRVVACYHWRNRNISDSIFSCFAVSAGNDEFATLDSCGRISVCIPELSSSEGRLCFSLQIRNIDVTVCDEAVNTIAEYSLKEVFLSVSFSDFNRVNKLCCSILCGNGDENRVAVCRARTYAVSALCCFIFCLVRTRVLCAVRLGDCVFIYIRSEGRNKRVTGYAEALQSCIVAQRSIADTTDRICLGGCAIFSRYRYNLLNFLTRSRNIDYKRTCRCSCCSRMTQNVIYRNTGHSAYFVRDVEIECVSILREHMLLFAYNHINAADSSIAACLARAGNSDGVKRNIPLGIAVLAIEIKRALAVCGSRKNNFHPARRAENRLCGFGFCIYDTLVIHQISTGIVAVKHELAEVGGSGDMNSERVACLECANTKFNTEIVVLVQFLGRTCSEGRADSTAGGNTADSTVSGCTNQQTALCRSRRNLNNKTVGANGLYVVLVRSHAVETVRTGSCGLEDISL